MTDMETNGYNNFHLTPRFATRIYYDWLVTSFKLLLEISQADSASDVPECDVAVWIAGGEGPANGTFKDILDLERAATTLNLLSLYHGKFILVLFVQY